MRRPVLMPFAGVILLGALASGCAGKDHEAGRAKQRTTASPSVAGVLWPAPPDPLERAVAAGLEPEVKEQLAFHVHVHLDVFVDGKPVTVPAGIGINIKDPKVKQFHDTPDGSTAYGGIERCSKPCISPLHTHDTTGIVHTESSTERTNTLGQFFSEWGLRLSSSCVAERCTPTRVAFYVNGSAYTKDPRAIPLEDHDEIAIVVGDAPPRIPKTADFSNA